MTVSDSTLEIDRTQAAHLVAAEQNFQKGFTLHIDHERRHCQFRKRWGLGSLHCAYAHALDILDTLSERYPTSFKITGERHNGEVPRQKPPPYPETRGTGYHG